MEETGATELPPPPPPEDQEPASTGLVERRLNTLKKRISGFLSNDSSDTEEQNEVHQNWAVPELPEVGEDGPGDAQADVLNDDTDLPNGDVVVLVDDGAGDGDSGVSPSPDLHPGGAVPEPHGGSADHPYENYNTLMERLGEDKGHSMLPPDPPTAQIIDIDEELDQGARNQFPTPPRSLIVDKEDDTTDDLPSVTPYCEVYEPGPTFTPGREVQEALDAMLTSVQQPLPETASQEWRSRKDSDGKSMPESDYADVENSVEIKNPKVCRRKWKLGFSDLGMDLVRACFAEALGTFFLILICVGCANSRVLDSLSSTNGTIHLQPTYYLAIAFGFGIGIGGIVHILSEASGGHVNPAVSFALFLDKRISFVCLIFYVISQFLGGFAGAGVLYGMGNHSDLGVGDIYGGNAYDSIEWYQAFLFEMFGTMFLILTILATINEKRGYVQSYLQPFAIGLAIFIMHIWLIPYTNCGINPVRGTVWNIVIGVAGDQSLVFLFAPLAGAGLAVPIFNYIFNPGYCS